MASEIVTVGSVKVSPGEVVHLDYEVGEVAGFPIRIPVSVINGNQKGPTLCITSGLHGCEYDSIEAAIRISNAFKSSQIAGRLIVLPIINLPTSSKRPRS